MGKRLNLSYTQIMMVMTVITVIIFSYLFLNNLAPFIGISVDETSEPDTYVITGLHRLGWGKAVGLSEGDVIVSVNEASPAEHDTIIRKQKIEQITSLTIERDDRLLSYQVRYVSDIFLQYFFYLILPSLYFLISIVFAYINIKRQDTGLSTLLITLTMFVVSLAYSASSSQIKFYPLAELILIINFLIAPSVFFHFIYQFFKERYAVWFNWWMVQSLYLFSVITIVFSLFVYDKLNINDLILTSFSISVFWILVQMISGLTQLKKESNKDTLYGLLYAIGLGVLPYIFFYIIPYFVIGEGIIPFEYVNLFFFFIPMGLMYMILTNQLYLLRVQIKKLPYYLIISIFLATVITLLHLMLFESSFQFRKEFSLFSYTLVLILGLFFAKKQLDHYFKPQLFVSINDFQASYYRFSTQLQTHHTRGDVIQSFVREIKEVIPLEHFKVLKHRSMLMPTKKTEGLPARYIPLLNYYLNQRLVVGRLNGRFGLYAIPINNYKGELFLFFFQPKQALDQDQLNYVSTLVQFVNLALENRTRIEDLLEELEQAKHTENMEWLSRLLFEWSEIERKQLALDLHDTFLQDLIVLKRDLESLRKSNTKSMDVYKGIEERMQDIIFDIRETTRHLYPTILDEVGLIEAIKELIEKFELQCNSKLVLETNLDADFYQSRFIQLLVYRAVQELLTNANKHAKASKVNLTITNEQTGMTIDYLDDGIGVDLAQKQPDGAHHLGLFALNERIKSFKGTFTFNSQVGEGVKVQIYIPYS
ncbi:two-component system, NarL family, sensor histidine kinase ComP [Halolactibacillus halophilus]|uniref:histidine kinase n=1 Tax=Halolactibacillus halophilus TaxID=306540 RepID=A0A1I5PRL9_9BACI|nr:ATP-binding protein [Halolactibacillus halophilus]GEM01595.1 histidine kinase [Halolactibacillus halophilus]SFP36674.1 two-component system, NarL family, sensor histidine kinase ComP [Halolactibacillus halophilus]